MARFDGSTFDEELDGERLEDQLSAVWGVLKDGNKWTVQAIHAIVGGTQTSISARCRDLRKEKFGGHNIKSERVGGTNGLWVYWLAPPEPERTIDAFHGEYRFLSNFYPAPIHYEGMDYYDVERAYQAAKTHNVEIKRAIAKARTPGIAKRMGRKIKPSDFHPDWENVKRDIMMDLVRIKFVTHELLGDQLIATGEDYLVEGNTHGDTFWGMVNGVGDNVLGMILMGVREELKG